MIDYFELTTCQKCGKIKRGYQFYSRRWECYDAGGVTRYPICQSCADLLQKQYMDKIIKQMKLD